MQQGNRNKSLEEETMTCDEDTITRLVHAYYMDTSMSFLITISTVVLFVGTRTIFRKIRRDMAQLTVIVIGAGPIGLTSALIAAHCKRVSKLVLYEEHTKSTVERRAYQIALQPHSVSFLRTYGVDFDNLEGLWHDDYFYTRAGIYLEYILHILPLYSTNIDLKFGTKFCHGSSAIVDKISGRKLIICCDGSSGLASNSLGLSDECTIHPSGIFGAVASIERNNKTLVPTPDRYVHNLSFDLSAYNCSPLEDNGSSKFTLRIFGNTQYKHLAIAVKKCDSHVVRALKTVLDKSMMRNIFLKCYNTYKRSDEASISDSYCLNNMKFSPRLYEIKLSQRIENVAYIEDCDMFITTEGDASITYNFNTGMEFNIGLQGLTALEPFVESIILAETNHSIIKALLFKMEHSEKICKDLLCKCVKEFMFE